MFLFTVAPGEFFPTPHILIGLKVSHTIKLWEFFKMAVCLR